MGAGATNRSGVHDRISMNATTTTTMAGPSKRRADSRWSSFHRAGLPDFG